MEEEAKMNRKMSLEETWDEEAAKFEFHYTFGFVTSICLCNLLNPGGPPFISCG